MGAGSAQNGSADVIDIISIDLFRLNIASFQVAIDLEESRRRALSESRR
jgi:hypothetical protein